MIKENLIFFVDAIIIRPEFDTQTKEFLKTKVVDFGSTYRISNDFLKKIIKTGVIDQIIANAQAKEEANLNKTSAGKGVLRFEKLYDAHRARLKQGDCTLILTEGDSAKAFVMTGIDIDQRNYYGVFPLKGKILNVRNEPTGKIITNEEIKAITQIVGLEHKKIYSDDLRGLRYGKIMILTDQDADGAHIKGLLMNFIHYYWPSLIKQKGFIRSVATPLVKATKGNGKNKQILAFINMQSFEEWMEKNNDGKGWNIKYYKGLGTSDPAESQKNVYKT